MHRLDRLWSNDTFPHALRTVVIPCMILTAPPVPTPAVAQEEEPPLEWSAGPFVGSLGEVAEIRVPEAFLFTGQDGTIRLLEASGNITSGNELGTVTPADPEASWFVIFEFDEIGYVRDDDKDDLDADALLESFRKGAEQANEQRRARGFPPLTVVGWETPPRYNEATHNLEWCLRGESEGSPVLNHNTRLLGRNGVMSATLVGDPADFPAAMPVAASLLNGFSFGSGHNYAEYRKGDRVAEIGLTALVAGGVGAVAAKTGILKKFGKLIVVGFVALIGVITRFLRALFGRSEVAGQNRTS